VCSIAPRNLAVNACIRIAQVVNGPLQAGDDGNARARYSELLCLRQRVSGAPSGVAVQDSYLVDSASSHMLVSKIKPCMSKYKQSIR
jgi:hypothetical protein